MALTNGICKMCDRECEVFDHNEQCIICTRLDALDKILIDMKKVLEALKTFTRRYGEH